MKFIPVKNTSTVCFAKGIVEFDLIHVAGGMGWQIVERAQRAKQGATIRSRSIQRFSGR